MRLLFAAKVDQRIFFCLSFYPSSLRLFQSDSVSLFPFPDFFFSTVFTFLFFFPFPFRLPRLFLSFDSVRSGFHRLDLIALDCCSPAHSHSGGVASRPHVRHEPVNCPTGRLLSLHRPRFSTSGDGADRPGFILSTPSSGTSTYTNRSAAEIALLHSTAVEPSTFRPVSLAITAWSSDTLQTLLRYA